MTQAVPAPTAIQNIPPADMKPGFVPPAQPAPVGEGAGASQPTQAAAQPDLAAAIAALTAAMGQNQAPAAPAAADVVAESPGGIPEDLNNFDVSGIDDPIIRSMATVMQTVGKGLDFNRAIGRAIDEGRVDLIDTAYITEKGGESAKEILTIANGIVQAIVAKGAAVTENIHKLAGGADKWSAGVAVFNQQAPQELRIVVSQMLDSGKDNLVDAGAKLIVEFAKNSGALPNVNPLLSQGAAAAGASQALSRAEFMEAHAKLDKYSRDYATQRAELFARRSLGKQLGK